MVLTVIFDMPAGNSPVQTHGSVDVSEPSSSSCWQVLFDFHDLIEEGSVKEVLRVLRDFIHDEECLEAVFDNYVRKRGSFFYSCSTMQYIIIQYLCIFVFICGVEFNVRLRRHTVGKNIAACCDRELEPYVLNPGCSYSATVSYCHLPLASFSCRNPLDSLF